MYEVKYRDGYVATMASNAITDNLFAKFDQGGNIFLLIESIINTRTNGMQKLQQYDFFITKSGTKRRKNTSKGWEVCIQQKDVSTTWNKLKDTKDSYPEQMSEYTVDNRVFEEPAFTWWTKHVLNKRYQTK